MSRPKGVSVDVGVGGEGGGVRLVGGAVGGGEAAHDEAMSGTAAAIAAIHIACRNRNTVDAREDAA